MKTNILIPVIEETTEVDWDKVYLRLNAADDALKQDMQASPEKTLAILKKRARAIAREPELNRKGEVSLTVIEFKLASETYAVESAFVREIYPMKDFTPLPGTPSFVTGIVNVRGQILSVVDLKKFFNLPGKGLGELNKLLIVCDDRMEFGILADVVLGTNSIPLSAIQPLHTSTGIGSEYLKGVTADCVIVLDAIRILHDQKIVVQDEVPQSALLSLKGGILDEMVQ